MDKVLINLEEDYCRKYFNKDIVTIDEILEKLNELDDELYEQKERYRELEEEVRECYRPIPLNDFYGVSDKDFL